MPKVALSDVFLESLNRLSDVPQRKVREFIRKFEADSTSNAINYERLQGHRNHHVRTVRIDQKYRVLSAGVKNLSVSCRAGQEAHGRSGGERISPRWIRLAGGVKRGPLAADETSLSAQPAKPGVIGAKSSRSHRASVTLLPESRADQQSSRVSFSLRSPWCDGSRLSYNDNQTRNPQSAQRTPQCCRRT